jgi:hypothetical protein
VAPAAASFVSEISWLMRPARAVATVHPGDVVVSIVTDTYTSAAVRIPAGTRGARTSGAARSIIG